MPKIAVFLAVGVALITTQSADAQLAWLLGRRSDRSVNYQSQVSREPNAAQLRTLYQLSRANAGCPQFEIKPQIQEFQALTPQRFQTITIPVPSMQPPTPQIQSVAAPTCGTASPPIARSSSSVEAELASLRLTLQDVVAELRALRDERCSGGLPNP